MECLFIENYASDGRYSCAGRECRPHSCPSLAHIRFNNLVHRTDFVNHTPPKVEGRFAKAGDRTHTVADKQHGAATTGHLRHLAKAALLEFHVADRKDFVNY